MSKLIFDTETTGLVDWKAPNDLDKQPRLVQLAGVLVDRNWEEQMSFRFMIKPEGFEIPETAAQIHKVTTERAIEYGTPLRTALSVFNNAVRSSAEAWAFNLAFDSIVMNSELKRIGQESQLLITETKCAMLQCKDILKLKPPYKGADYKWPKLSEAYEFFFKEKMEGAHDALADVRATVRVMRAVEAYLKA